MCDAFIQSRWSRERAGGWGVEQTPCMRKCANQGCIKNCGKKGKKQDPATLASSNYLESKPSKLCLHSGFIEPDRAHSPYPRALWCWRSAGTLPSFFLFFSPPRSTPWSKSERQACEPPANTGVAYQTRAGEELVLLSLRAGRLSGSRLKTEGIVDVEGG